MKRLPKQTQGFTLVELVLAIAIVGFSLSIIFNLNTRIAATILRAQKKVLVLTSFDTIFGEGRDKAGVAEEKDTPLDAAKKTFSSPIKLTGDSSDGVYTKKPATGVFAGYNLVQEQAKIGEAFECVQFRSPFLLRALLPEKDKKEPDKKGNIGQSAPAPSQPAANAQLGGTV
ncbi:MAG: hypothetical protein UU47_C0004G0047 [candidate division TM6 bacterium GW2011_GWE2_41_16]|nr:MAG: hypothetical protein UU47_C0004G0047 [candidate division TM6 bacterium GW2011_GWE2_41_16]